LKKKLSFFLSFILFFQLFTFNNSKVKAAGITLKSITLDKKRLTKGESAKITVDFSTPNDSLKVHYDVWVSFLSPSGERCWSTLTYADGVFSNTINITDGWISGNYKLEEVWIRYGSNEVIYYTTEFSLNNNPTYVPKDLSSWNFDVYGTSAIYPIFKNITYTKSTYTANEWADIQVEAEYNRPMNSEASIWLQTTENKLSSEVFLGKASETFSNGTYKAVYKGKFDSLEGKCSGQWFPNKISLRSENGENYVGSVIYHSKTIQAVYAKDFSGSSFIVTNDVTPGPKLIGSSIDNGGANVPLTNQIELYFDKKLTYTTSNPEYNFRLTDEAGNSLWINRESSGNTLIMDVGDQLKPNTKYLLQIGSGLITAEDGTTNDAISNFSFTTGSKASSVDGIKHYFTSNTEITSNVKYNSDLIIAPGVNLKVRQGGSLTTSGNVIVYGSVINEGNFTVGKSLYINQLKSAVDSGSQLQNGTFVNTGIKAENSIVTGNYPNPMLYVSPEISGNIAATRIDFAMNTYPFLSYTINSEQGITSKEGIQKKSITLNYGFNQLQFKVQDPFGNSTVKAITLNNTSSPIKILDAFPKNNYTKLPINTGIYIKFDRKVSKGEGINNIILKDGNGNQQMTTYKIQDDEIILYKVGTDLDYNTNYTVKIPKNAVVDEVGNYLTNDYIVTFKTGEEVTVLAGKDRFETSIKIEQEGWVRSDYAILATGNDFPDALSAAPLAAKYDAPILLVKSNTLDAQLENEINRLQVKHIFIAGGTGVVSKAIEDKLKGKGISVIRLCGIDRYATSVAIAKQLDINENSKVFLATGENFPDALSIASIAAAKQMPIILTEKMGLPKATVQFFKETGIREIYIIGGEGVIQRLGDEVVFTWERRIAGKDRYETNFNVLLEFGEELDFTYTFFATGENFPDALSGSALAGRLNAPIVLVSPYMSQESIDDLHYNKDIMKMKYILGGEGVVPRALINKIIK